MNSEVQNMSGKANPVEFNVKCEGAPCPTVRTLSIEEVLLVAGGPETDVGEGTI